ncbi:MAG TPA: ATP-binding protein [Pyrinomonadaceae bacterium]|nr:ATP-binding protein [Pyrinomonadaceae bacterium]
MSKTRANVKAERGEAATLGNRLWWLVLGRLIAALLLLAASAAWRHNGFVTQGDGSLRTTFSAGVAALVLSLVYAFVLRFSFVPVRFQIEAQFLFDVLLVTWLVWATGDLYSPYAALYIVVISLASIFLGAREALLTSVGCAFCYTMVMLSIALNWLYSRGGDVSQVPLGRALGTIAFNDIAFLVVGLLAAQLAARQKRSDVQLIEATHALDNLRALHERVIESIRSGLVTTDLEGRVYTFNLAAEEITGYRAADLRGEDIAVILGDIKDKIEASLRASSEGHPNPRYEAECQTAEGLRLRLGYSISPLYTEGGKTPGLVISFQDLTDVRSLEETSRRQDKLAAVGRVAAGIAHEIRNPLAAMRGSIQVLSAGVTADSAESELMGIVLRESDRLNQIITDFLTYARPRPVTLVETDVREPLRETFALLRHSPEIRDGHAIVDDLPAEPVRAMIDAAGIKQVFWNLARNALHAMPDGGTLRAELLPSAHDSLRITFTDTGRGMSPEQVERLFEPFSSSTTGGTGLGLSIVYQIVRDHGGTINVRSRQGHGTTITVELPTAMRGQRSEVGGQ